MNVGSFGRFISKSFSMDREWDHFDEEGTMKLNEKNITKVFEDFLVYADNKIKSGRQNFIKIFSDNPKAFKKYFKTRHLDMLEERSNNDININTLLYHLTEDTRFLSDEVHDIFIF